MNDNNYDASEFTLQMSLIYMSSELVPIKIMNMSPPHAITANNMLSAK